MTSKVRQGVTGPKLILRRKWEPQLADVLKNEGLCELECNFARGWEGDDISFLSDLTFLKGLWVTPRRPLDTGPINNLHSLVYLKVSGPCGGTVDFGNFPQLRYCYVEWWRGVESVLQCKSLERAYFDRCKIRESHRFKDLANLQRLVIGNGPLREVVHLDNLRNIDYLGLYYLRNLESLQGIENLHRLNYLDIAGCRRLKRLDEIAGLPALEFCNLSDNGTFESLKPLRGMKSLKQLLFYGTTKILDGDMTVLNTLPNLNRVSFANRRHYSHRASDFPQFTSPAPMITRFPIDDNPNLDTVLKDFIEENPDLRVEKFDPNQL